MPAKKNFRPFIVMLIAVAFAIFALTLDTQAQDALPVPPAASVVRWNTPIPSYPANGVHPISIGTAFIWSDTGAPNYQLSLTIIKTGQTFKMKLPSGVYANCADGNCTFYATDSFDFILNLFKNTKSGDLVRWNVAAIDADGQKHVSASTTNAIREVDATILNTPTANAVLSSATAFTWNDTFGALAHTLIIRDIATGQKVFKTTIDSLDCTSTCSLNPFVSGSFQPGHTYVWFVKSISMLGEKAKSGKAQFTLANV